MPGLKPPKLRSRALQALYEKAADQLKAGLTPAIDALRSQVELQTRQQQLIVARNELAKERLRSRGSLACLPGRNLI